MLHPVDAETGGLGERGSAEMAGDPGPEPVSFVHDDGQVFGAGIPVYLEPSDAPIGPVADRIPERLLGAGVDHNGAAFRSGDVGSAQDNFRPAYSTAADLFCQLPFPVGIGRTAGHHRGDPGSQGKPGRRRAEKSTAGHVQVVVHAYDAGDKRVTGADDPG